MSGLDKPVRTAAQMQIENLRKLKALQEPSRMAPEAKPAARAAEVRQAPPQAVKPAPAPQALPPLHASGGLLVTELIDEQPMEAVPPAPVKRAKPAKKAGGAGVPGRTHVLVDTLKYRRLKAKWKLERRFKTEKEYWDWALEQLLNTHSVKPAPNTAAQFQAQWLEKLKRGSSEGNL